MTVCPPFLFGARSRRGAKRMRVFVVVAFAASPTALSHAETQDARTASSLEQVLATDAALSVLDFKLRDSYEFALSRLSVQGKAFIEEGEASWVKYISQICRASEVDDQTAWSKKCLAKEYLGRILYLKDLIITRGAFQFISVDRNCAHKASDDNTGSHPGWATHHWAWPRIDRPQTPLTERWNQLAADASGRGEDCEDADEDTKMSYGFGLANARLISVDWSYWFYGHGAAHGNGTSYTATMVLSPELHALRPEDLFRPEAPWHERLGALLLAELRRTVPTDQFPLYGDFNGFAAQIASDPTRWALGMEGITFNFNRYEIGPYVYNPPTITLAWSDLKDILIADPPVP